MNALAKKLRTKAKEAWRYSLIKASLYLHAPWLTAWIFSRLAYPIGKPAEYRVLALGRSIFIDDLLALAEYSGRIQYRVIHLNYWQILFAHLFSQEDRKLITESNYHAEKHGQQGGARYYRYLEKMLPYLLRYMKFQAVLTGNLGYIVQQELARLCVARGVPFIVLHKEAIVVSDAYKNFLDNYKHHHFVGTKILFYNRQCMNGFLGLHLPGLNPEKARFVGIPRFDRYFQPGSAHATPEKQIVLFSFLPRYSFRFLTSDEEILRQVEARGIEFFRAVMSYAQKHPEVQVVAKTKVAEQYHGFMRKLYSESYPSGLQNFRITYADDPSELIRASEAVLGFNSTTLIEALLAGRIILSPYFGDIYLKGAWSFFDKHPQLVRYVRTTDDLEKYLAQPAVPFQHDQAMLNNFLEEYISTTHGGASQNAEDEIIKAINTTAQAAGH